MAIQSTETIAVTNDPLVVLQQNPHHMQAQVVFIYLERMVRARRPENARGQTTKGSSDNATFTFADGLRPKFRVVLRRTTFLKIAGLPGGDKSWQTGHSHSITDSKRAPIRCGVHSSGER